MQQAKWIKAKLRSMAEFSLIQTEYNTGWMFSGKTEVDGLSYVPRSQAVLRISIFNFFCIL